MHNTVFSAQATETWSLWSSNWKRIAGPLALMFIFGALAGALADRYFYFWTPERVTHSVGPVAEEFAPQTTPQPQHMQPQETGTSTETLPPITVKQGRDYYFSVLSENIYHNGKAWFWRPLADAMGIDPDHLRVGQTLRFPRQFGIARTYEARLAPIPTPNRRDREGRVGFAATVTDEELDSFPNLVHDLYGDGSPEAVATAARTAVGLDADEPMRMAIGQSVTFPSAIIVKGRTLSGNLTLAKQRSEERFLAMLGQRIGTNPSPLPEHITLISTPTMPFLAPPKADVDGREILLSRDDTARIHAGRELQTCLVAGKEDRCDLVSWAQSTKHGTAILKMNLREIPNGPFTVLVAGKKDPITIDGERLREAQPITGGFPSPPPSSSGRFLQELKGVGVRGGIGTLTGGPIFGAAMGLGPPIAGRLAHHLFFAKTKEKAQKAYTHAIDAAKLPAPVLPAVIKTPKTTKEIGQ